MVGDIDIAKALAVYGWTTAAELRWLAMQARGRKCILEIGSAFGRSTVALALHCAGVVVVVDNWAGDVWNCKGLKPDQLYGEFIRNLEQAGVREKVIVMREDHARYRPPACDMVFIDGNHSLEGVRRDILRCLPALEPGGCLCGHDLQMPTVREAVLGALPQSQVLTAKGTTIWWWMKPWPQKRSEKIG